MVFWQLTIDANDPARLARFWAQALGYQPEPPARPTTTLWAHYRFRLGAEHAFKDRLFDPEGLRPPIWFQQVPDPAWHLSRFTANPGNRVSQLARSSATQSARGFDGNC
jgi:hypothetical protein